MITTFPFDVPSNYIVSSGMEIAGGEARLKAEVKPAGATFYNGFDRGAGDFDANWGDGVLTGAQTGGALITAGKLDLRGATAKRVEWSGVANAPLQYEGAIRFKWTPNFSGVPASLQNIVWIFLDDPIQGRNLIGMECRPDGDWAFFVRGLSGNIIWADAFAQALFLVPVAGTEYEIEINFRVLLADQQYHLYVDGTRMQTVSTGLYRDRNACDLIIIGQQHIIQTQTPDFQIDDFLVFGDAMQHTGASYVPDWSVVPAWDYSTGEETTEPTTVIRTDLVEALALTATTNVRVILQKDGVDYWWDGGAWAVSDGSYAEANPEADLTPVVLAQLTIIGTNLGWKLVFDAANIDPVQENAEELSITFSFTGPVPTSSQRTIFGYLLDILGNPLVGKVVKVSLIDALPEIGDGNVVIDPLIGQTVTDANGYFNLDVLYDGTVPSRLMWEINGKTIFTDFPKDAAPVEISELAYGVI